MSVYTLRLPDETRRQLELLMRQRPYLTSLRAAVLLVLEEGFRALETKRADETTSDA